MPSTIVVSHQLFKRLEKCLLDATFRELKTLQEVKVCLSKIRTISGKEIDIFQYLDFLELLCNVLLKAVASNRHLVNSFEQLFFELYNLITPPNSSFDPETLPRKYKDKLRNIRFICIENFLTSLRDEHSQLLDPKQPKKLVHYQAEYDELSVEVEKMKSAPKSPVLANDSLSTVPAGGLIQRKRQHPSAVGAEEAQIVASKCRKTPQSLHSSSASASAAAAMPEAAYDESETEPVSFSDDLSVVAKQTLNPDDEEKQNSASVAAVAAVDQSIASGTFSSRIPAASGYSPIERTLDNAVLNATQTSHLPTHAAASALIDLNISLPIQQERLKKLLDVAIQGLGVMLTKFTTMPLDFDASVQVVGLQIEIAKAHYWKMLIEERLPLRPDFFKAALTDVPFAHSLLTGGQPSPFSGLVPTFLPLFPVTPHSEQSLASAVGQFGCLSRPVTLPLPLNALTQTPLNSCESLPAAAAYSSR